MASGKRRPHVHALCRRHTQRWPLPWGALSPGDGGRGRSSGAEPWAGDGGESTSPPHETQSAGLTCPPTPRGL